MNNTKTVANYTYRTRSDGHIIPSPCVSVCTMHLDQDLCSGCLRTLDEIAQWSSMANAEKEFVWREIGRRRAKQDSTQAPGTSS